MKKPVFILLLITLWGGVLNAQTFSYLGINYKITSANIVEISSNNGLTGYVEIPEKIIKTNIIYTVTSVGDSAFFKCVGLISISLPQTLNHIGEAAFRGCSGLIGINIPNLVTQIGNRSFSFCSGLKTLNLGESVQTIGNEAFYNCTELTTLNIPNNVTHIGSYAFNYCTSLNVINWGASVTNIGDNAFNTCRGLLSLNIPNSVLNIGNECFFGCSGITTVNLGNGITNIADYVFSNCSNLISVSFPANITSIGIGAFSRCNSLEKINIPKMVTSIGSTAFSRCTRLKSVIIPKSVTSIGSRAFFRCDILSSVTVNWDSPLTVNQNLFELSPITSAILYVPNGTLTVYKNTPVWQNFGSIIENAVLPFVLISFTAKAISTGNAVNWVTTNMVNVKSITVERLETNNTFLPLVTLIPTINHYIDFNSLPGTNYYRLSSTDNDGTVYTYHIIAVVNGLTNQISVYPNPVSNGILNVVTSNFNILSVSIISQSGVQINTVANSNNSKKVEINTQGLAKGVYVLKIKEVNRISVKEIIIN